MTQTEHEHLKATLKQGCTSERQTLIWLMTPRQRAEFVSALVFAPSDPLQAATWQMFAIALAQDLLKQLDQPAPCADPFNADCDCVPCEMKRAVSTAELTAPEAPVTISATFDHILQEGL